MLALDPSCKLYRCRTNIAFVKYNEDSFDYKDMKTIHPNTAIVLSHFNGANSIDDIRKIVEYLFSITEQEAIEFLNRLQTEWKEYLIEVNDIIRSDNPFDFIIPKNK